jgi:hypothetical protein
MAYILTLLTALTALLLFSPQQVDLKQAVMKSTRALMSTITLQNLDIEKRFNDLRALVREKSMKLLREQLHETIDDQVR